MPKGHSGRQSAAQRIAAASKSIARNDYETAIAFDAQGNELFRQVGAEHSVSFTREQQAQMKGAIVVHNHPVGKDNDPTIFSSSDIRSAYNLQQAEERIVAGTQTHSIVWTEKATADSIRKLTARMEKEEKAMQRDTTIKALLNRIANGESAKNGGVTVAQFNAMSQEQRRSTLAEMSKNRYNSYVYSVTSLLKTSGNRYGVEYSAEGV